MKKTFKCYSDPGHGWAAVKRKLLVELGLAAKISAFSFERGKTVYLEEDSDVAKFAAAFTAKFGEAPKFVSGSFCNSSSPIRSYARFSPTEAELVAAVEASYKALGFPAKKLDAELLETVESIEATLEDFNYVGSKHHY